MDEMTNYTNMLRMNEKVCEEKRILAIDTIRRMVRDNEQITICELTKQTGLSRSFFYKNAVVNMELILSILVDTFISKISFPMQPGPEIGSISDA